MSQRDGGGGGILQVALLVWTLGARSDSQPASAPPPDGIPLNYSDLIGPEARHVISAWGAPVRRRPDDLNETYDFGNIVILGGLPFPRQGHLLGWRAHFSRIDVPVDFQIWRPEGGEDPEYMKLVAHTGPVFAESPGTSVFTLKGLGIKETHFNKSDFIGIGLESVSPVSLSWQEEVPCPMWEGKTEGFLLTCTSHRFRRARPGCTTYSLQALVEWSTQVPADTCSMPGGPEAPPVGGRDSYPLSEDYEMPVYTMPCKEVLLHTDTSQGFVELLNFTTVPAVEDVCLLLILNLGDPAVTSRFAVRAEVTDMDVTVFPENGECSPLGPLVEFQDGPFMASHVVRSLCEWDPDDHVITVCERHLRILMSNRGKLNRLRIQYRVVSKAITSCQMSSPWFPRKGSRVSAIVAIVVISLLAVIIAFGVTKLAKRGAPLFRERVNSPSGSELFNHDDLMYRTSLSLSSPTSSNWAGDQAQTQAQQGHLLADVTRFTNDVTSVASTSDRVVDVSINDIDLTSQDDDLLSPLSLRSGQSMTSSVLTLTTPTSAQSGAAVMTISQAETHLGDRIT